jgi:tetrahydromethanopterin S-methyltransferase subunit G
MEDELKRINARLENIEMKFNIVKTENTYRTLTIIGIIFTIIGISLALVHRVYYSSTGGYYDTLRILLWNEMLLFLFFGVSITFIGYSLLFDNRNVFRERED